MCGGEGRISVRSYPSRPSAPTGTQTRLEPRRQAGQISARPCQEIKARQLALMLGGDHSGAGGGVGGWTVVLPGA